MPASALGFYQPYYDVMPDGKAMILDERRGHLREIACVLWTYGQLEGKILIVI